MSTITKPNRKTYDLEFKKQAVQLVITSGRPLTQIARELGVSPWNLRDWRVRLQPQLAQQPETLEAMRLRLAQLERDNCQLRQQRDILKKNFGHNLDDVSARYQRMQAMESEYHLTELCLAFDVSRSGYYDWCVRKPSTRQQANTQLLAEIQTLRQSEEACYGSPRMTEELQARGYKCSENRIARLMHAHGLRAQAQPRFVPCTTDSDHDEPIAPNRLAERATPAGPNQIWLQDITYVPTAQGWMYLALVMDLWSRKIVGWAMADHLRSELVVSALQMAHTQRRPGRGLLVHSDRGVQYASRETREFLACHGCVTSMSRPGNPYDNAWMESAIGKIKSEVLGRAVPADHAAAKRQLFIGIESWYNQRRRHSSLGYQSPVAFETQFMKN